MGALSPSLFHSRAPRAGPSVRSQRVYYIHIYIHARCSGYIYIYRRGVIRVRPREPRGPLTNVLKRVQSRKSLISFLNGPHRRRFMALLSPPLSFSRSRARAHARAVHPQLYRAGESVKWSKSRAPRLPIPWSRFFNRGFFIVARWYIYVLWRRCRALRERRIVAAAAVVGTSLENAQNQRFLQCLSWLLNSFYRISVYYVWFDLKMKFRWIFSFFTALVKAIILMQCGIYIYLEETFKSLKKNNIVLQRLQLNPFSPVNVHGYFSCMLKC